eukprot:2405230-Pleurochrysis_carterae.AAC.1
MGLTTRQTRGLPSCPKVSCHEVPLTHGESPLGRNWSERAQRRGSHRGTGRLFVIDAGNLGTALDA